MIKKQIRPQTVHLRYLVSALETCMEKQELENLSELLSDASCDVFQKNEEEVSEGGVENTFETSHADTVWKLSDLLEARLNQRQLAEAKPQIEIDETRLTMVPRGY